MRQGFIGLIIVLNVMWVQCQLPNSASFRYSIIKSEIPITIDGVSDEVIWSDVPQLLLEWLNKPIDNEKSNFATKVRMTYDDQNLYVFAICEDIDGKVIQTLKRDNFGNSDEFAIYIDGLGQNLSGMGFGVNAAGAQTEATFTLTDDDSNWDNKWYSYTKIYDDHWTVEMAIPFKTLRYNDGQKEWNINFSRTNPGSNHTITWAPIPRQFDVSNLGYFGKLIWEIAPKKQGGNVSIIPYATSKFQRQIQLDEKSVSAQFGGDAKISLSSSMNMDLTYNPDFSQVEVDQQVTNLTRFNIFFPERRQFFLENNDIFQNFGLNEEQLFYTRRIGLDQFGGQVPISYGARLSGNIANKTRIGLLNIQTKGTETNNYSALAFQQSILKRSFIRGIFLNRQNAKKNADFNDYGRNAGIDYAFSTNDGKYSTYGGYLKSFKAGLTKENNQYYGGVNYNGTNFRAYIEAQHVAKDFYSDMGFNTRIENYNPDNNEVKRIVYTNIGSMANYYYYPQNKWINTHWSGIENFVWVNDGTTKINEWYTRIRHFLFFHNTSALRFRFNNHFVDLLNPFDLGEAKIERGQYRMQEFNVQYNSDNRRKIVGELFGVYGGFYGGTKLTLRTNLTLRVQPWGNFTLGVDQNFIDINSQSTTLNLINGRAEINFSTKLFWTTFLQYNTQSERFNVNSRIQFRYKPMSDFYLVYLDNYSTADKLINNGRSLVLKLNYWLSI